MNHICRNLEISYSCLMRTFVNFEQIEKNCQKILYFLSSFASFSSQTFLTDEKLISEDFSYFLRNLLR